MERRYCILKGTIYGPQNNQMDPYKALVTDVYNKGLFIALETINRPLCFF